MNRRALLTIGGITITPLAGCLTDSTPADGNSTETPAETPSTRDTPSVQETSENTDSKRLLVASDGGEEVVLLRHSHVAKVGGILNEEENHGTYAVEVELTDEGKDSFYDGLEELNAADNPRDVELYTYLNGEIVFTTGITANVAERPDPEADKGIFRISAPGSDTAEELKEDLDKS